MVLFVDALAQGQGSSASKGSETVLTGGEAAEVSGDGVKVIPINSVPVRLRGEFDSSKARSGH